MTSSQIPSRIAMPCPFGGFGTTNITPIQTAQGNDVNFQDGFPSIYGAPTGNNGKFVTRKEMNAIGNLASNDLFYHKCGGLNTFDKDFCIQIGGYPKGAILDRLVGIDLKKVVSLVDNNKVCFTGDELTDEDISNGLKEGAVDNINWSYLNQPSIPSEFYNEDFSVFSGFSILTTFVAPTSGILNVTVKNPVISENVRATSTIPSGSFWTYISHNIKPCCVMIRNITNASSGSVKFPAWSQNTPSSTATYDYGSWGICYGSCQGIDRYTSGSGSSTVINQKYGDVPLALLNITAGNKYMVVIGAGMEPRNSLNGDGTMSVSTVDYLFSGNISLSIK